MKLNANRDAQFEYLKIIITYKKLILIQLRYIT